MSKQIKKVTTKKEHRCSGCSRKFPKGTRMETWTFLDASGDNGWCTWYICKVCQAVEKEINCADYDGMIYEDFAIKTDREYWEKRCAEIEAQEQ